jgi:hypothetical protein
MQHFVLFIHSVVTLPHSIIFWTSVTSQSQWQRIVVNYKLGDTQEGKINGVFEGSFHAFTLKN